MGFWWQLGGATAGFLGGWGASLLLRGSDSFLVENVMPSVWVAGAIAGSVIGAVESTPLCDTCSGLAMLGSAVSAPINLVFALSLAVVALSWFSG